MANQINGRVIGVSQLQTIASSDPQKQPMQKREIYIDCTRYDPYTGERSEFENKPLLEFVGKALEKVNPVLDTIAKGDVVSISFDLQGIPYTEKGTNKPKVMTKVRCYDIAVIRKANGQPVQAPAPAPQPEPAPQAQSPFPPAENNQGDLPF